MRESLKVERWLLRLILRGEKGVKKEIVNNVVFNSNIEYLVRLNMFVVESVFGMRSGIVGGDKKMKGWVKSLKGVMGMGKV